MFGWFKLDKTWTSLSACCLATGSISARNTSLITTKRPSFLRLYTTAKPNAPLPENELKLHYIYAKMKITPFPTVLTFSYPGMALSFLLTMILTITAFLYHFTSTAVTILLTKCGSHIFENGWESKWNHMRSLDEIHDNTRHRNITQWIVPATQWSSQRSEFLTMVISFCQFICHRFVHLLC